LTPEAPSMSAFSVGRIVSTKRHAGQIKPSSASLQRVSRDEFHRLFHGLVKPGEKFSKFQKTRIHQGEIRVGIIGAFDEFLKQVETITALIRNLQDA